MSLRTVELPDSATTIEARAFSGMTAMKTLRLGKELTTISAAALDGCNALERIEVAADNESYADVDGVLYYADRACIVKYPAGRQDAGYAVDGAAVLVEARAFANATKLRQLTLSQGIEQIGAEAFRGSGLEEIDLSALSGLDELPEGAFDGCGRLGKALLPEGLSAIGDDCFHGCNALKELDIPDSVRSIGYGAVEASTLLIVGADSEAMRYAQAKGLNYRLRDAELIPATAIQLEKTSLTLEAGTGYTLPAQVLPANATDTVYWYSDDLSVLRVDGGYIRPLKPGETNITISAGDVEVTVPVSVIKSTIEIAQSQTCVFPDSPLQLALLETPADNVGEIGEVRWSCVGASIDDQNLLSATRSGMATVRAQASNGSVAEMRFPCVVKDDALALPSLLSSIEAEAFMDNAAIRCVVVPESVAAIGDRAFANCGALELVYIPGDTTISGSALNGSPNVTVVCHEGSTAESDAKAGNISCYIIP